MNEHHHLEEALRLLFRGIIPIVFLIGGIIILALRIPGWSLLLGLPTTVFGVVFLIYTYDEVVRRTIVPTYGKLTKCSVCGKPTPTLPGIAEEDTICGSCKRDISRGVRKESGIKNKE